MSSTSSDRKATAAKFGARPGPREDTTVPAAKGTRTKPVPHTVKLPPARHHSWEEWRREQAQQHGRVRVTSQLALDRAVHLVLTDETTARKLSALIGEAGE